MALLTLQVPVFGCPSAPGSGSARLMGPGPSPARCPTAGGWETESRKPSWQADQNQGAGFGTALGRYMLVGTRPHQAKCFYDFFLGSCLLNPKGHANPKEKLWPQVLPGGTVRKGQPSSLNVNGAHLSTNLHPSGLNFTWEGWGLRLTRGTPSDRQVDGASGYGWALSIWSKEVTFPAPGAGVRRTDSDPVCCHKGPGEAQLSSRVRSRRQRRWSSLLPSLGVPSRA